MSVNPRSYADFLQFQAASPFSLPMHGFSRQSSFSQQGRLYIHSELMYISRHFFMLYKCNLMWIDEIMPCLDAFHGMNLSKAINAASTATTCKEEQVRSVFLVFVPRFCYCGYSSPEHVLRSITV